MGDRMDCAWEAPKLLVSVRNAAEALAAARGGANVIDIKEPRHGPLGAAMDQWDAISKAIGSSPPLSAAMGELAEWDERQFPAPLPNIRWWKFGFAGENDRDWTRRWHDLLERIPRTVAPIVAAYADWHAAGAPPLHELMQLACRTGCGLLIDTYHKGRGTLWDFLTVKQLTEICHRCHADGIQVAVAGSLKRESIPMACASRCDWVALRGAACMGGRDGIIVESRVRDLAAATVFPPVA